MVFPGFFELPERAVLSADLSKASFRDGEGLDQIQRQAHPLPLAPLQSLRFGESERATRESDHGPQW